MRRVAAGQGDQPAGCLCCQGAGMRRMTCCLSCSPTAKACVGREEGSRGQLV